MSRVQAKHDNCEQRKRGHGNFIKYDHDNRGNVTRVWGTGLPANGAAYTYDPNSDLLHRIEFKDSSATIATVTRAHESTRNLLTSVENKWGATVVSKYAYANDDLGRREHVIRTGTAFAADHSDVWGYNARNELTASDRFDDATVPLTSNPVAALNRDYAYDPTLDTIRRQGQVGNRTSYTQGTASALYYCANELNQYETAEDDASDCPPTGGADESFTYDADGNLTQDGTYDYAWDAENP